MTEPLAASPDPISTSPNRGSPIWAIAVRLLLSIALFFFIWLSVPWIAGERAGLLEDDSYFYAQIAYNVQKIGSFSFDGVSPTSGFHLLWGAILGLLSQGVGVITQDKTIHLAVYASVWCGVLIALASRIGRTRTEKLVLVGIGLLTAALMETALLSLILIALAVHIRDLEKRAPRPSTLFALCALVPLVRIDALPVLLLWMPLVWPRREALQAFVGGLALGVAIHFGSLEIFFGHPYSVSSMLKASAIGRGPQIARSLGEVGTLVRFVLLLVLVVWGLTAVHRKGTDWKTHLLWLAPVGFTLAHVLWSDVRSWYFLPGLSFAFWAGVEGPISAHGKRGANPRGKAPRELIWTFVVASTILLSAYKLYRFIPLNTVRTASWEFMERVRQIVPPSGRIYQVDGSGFTGYWSERSLLNGDGLVNTYEYAARMRDKKLAGYFEENDVCYVITDAPLRGKKDALVRRGGLVLRQKDATEVLRSSAYGWSKNPNAHFILWRLNEPRCTRTR